MKLLYALLVLILIVLSESSWGQNARYKTVTLKATVASTNQYGIYYYAATNETLIAAGETAELMTMHSSGPNPFIMVRVEKDGLEFTPGPASAMNSGGVGSVVSGPANFRMAVANEGSAGLITLRITPEAYDPNRSIVLEPSTNQTVVTLECSTNLVHWTTTTNGVYGSPNEAKFFRIKAEKMN